MPITAAKSAPNTARRPRPTRSAVDGLRSQSVWSSFEPCPSTHGSHSSWLDVILLILPAAHSQHRLIEGCLNGAWHDFALELKQWYPGGHEQLVGELVGELVGQLVGFVGELVGELVGFAVGPPENTKTVPTTGSVEPPIPTTTAVFCDTPKCAPAHTPFAPYAGASLVLCDAQLVPLRTNT